MEVHLLPRNRYDDLPRTGLIVFRAGGDPGDLSESLSASLVKQWASRTGVREVGIWLRARVGGAETRTKRQVEFLNDVSALARSLEPVVVRAVVVDAGTLRELVSPVAQNPDAVAAVSATRVVRGATFAEKPPSPLPMNAWSATTSEGRVGVVLPAPVYPLAEEPWTRREAVSTPFEQGPASRGRKVVKPQYEFEPDLARFVAMAARIAGVGAIWPLLSDPGDKAAAEEAASVFDPPTVLTSARSPAS